MEIIQTEKEEYTLVAVSGRLDASTAHHIEQEFLRNEDGGDKKLLIDLAGLEYISSAGLRVMLITAKKINAGHGRLCLINLKPQVKEVFDISGFTALFNIAGSEEEALYIFND